MSAEFKPVIVILAAGNSQRFQGVKTLAAINWLGQQHSMVKLAVDKLRPINAPIIIATGLYHQQIITSAIPGVSYHYCNQAHLGMGHTIAQVTQHVLTSLSASHIFITLADQIAIEPAQFLQLAKQSASHPEHIVCSTTSKGLTAPALFPAQDFTALSQLTGDKGAKSILLAQRKRVISVELEQALIDIDHQQDLINWNNNHQHQRGQA